MEREHYYANIKLGKLTRGYQLTQQDILEAQYRLGEYFAQFARLFELPPQIFLSPKIQDAIPQLDKITEAVNFYLLLDYARRQGIATPPEEIMMMFRARWPKDTAASLRRYMDLRNIDNEQSLIWLEQQDANVSKAKYFFFTEARASLFELWQQFLLTDEEIKIDYVKIPVAEFEEKIEPTEEELREFYAEHKEDYRIPEKYKFSYVKLGLQDFGTTVSVSEEEVQKFYAENKEQFKIPKRVKARRILIKIPEDATAEELGKLRKKAEDIYQRTQKGEAFETLADNFSDEYVADGTTTPTKTGGLVGWISSFSTQIYGEAFVQKVLSLDKPGQITQPFRTERGFEIVKAEEIKPEEYRPYEEVGQFIKSSLFSQRCKEIVGQKANELSLDLYKYTSIEALAKKVEKSVLITAPIEAAEYFFPEIGNLTEDSAAVDEMIELKEIKIFPLADSVVIMQLQETIPSYIPELAEVKEQAKINYKYEKAKEQAKEIAVKVQSSALKVQLSRDTFTTPALQIASQDLQTTYQLRVQTSDYFTRDKLLPELGQIPNFGRFTLTTKLGEVSLSESVGADNKTEAYIVWLMKERKQPSLDKFKKELARLEREFIQIKRESILSEYLADTRKRVKVDINPRFLNP